MFSKVLIANRGTIRAKCVQAVRELGGTAAVFYSAHDNMSHGVRMADEAHQLHTSDPARAYYDADAIVTLASRIGADAVHPGYGFLAENISFVEALAGQGIRFIGLTAAQLRLVTDKPRLKKEAERAGLTVIPGSHPCSTLKELQAAAKELGYPVIMKPVAGFGGAGLSVVNRDSELKVAYESFLARAHSPRNPQREVFLERFLARAQHIEFPVLRDANGNVLVLPEIEGSVQRRFQKIVVETPSAYPDRELIRRLAILAKNFVGKLDLVGLVSVEFLLIGNEGYFLEINSYVPPWHMASAQLTGVDLLREQIRIAAGDNSELPARDLSPRGHVIGAAVNAEDPSKDFLPSPGTIQRFDAPLAVGALVNATAENGATVSAYYEPTLAHVVVSDSSRDEAIVKLKVALREFTIEGVKTNLPFLRSLLASPALIEGKVDVSYLLDRHNVGRILEDAKSEREEEVAALIAALTLHMDSNSQQILSAAADRNDKLSFWNLTSRFFNRNTMDF